MEKKLIDMHMHTTYSDGELTPDELIELAVENNISVMSITDHNTINGIKNINRENKNIKDNKIQIINGIELSAKVPKGRMHILGYDYDINSPILNEKMSKLKDNSTNSVLSVIEQIKKDYNISFTYEDLKKLINEPHNLGRPDVARMLLKNGYVKTIQEAFDKYLEDAHEKVRGRNKGLKYYECLDLIKQSGGIPVLAHPKSLELSEKEFLILLKDMIKCGLQGIEVYHYSHTKEEMDFYEKVAHDNNLLISGGSDYHGPKAKPDIYVGTGRNNIKIKRLSLVDEINRRTLQS